MQCLCFYSIIVIIGQFLTEISFWSETTSSLPLHTADNNEWWPTLRTGLSNMESRNQFPRTTGTLYTSRPEKTKPKKKQKTISPL